MALQIGSAAPDFEANTTEGRIRFHDWIGDSWAVLFSHPKDFTPVCTTELGYMARIKPEFEKRNTKIIGLSVDPVTSHSKWADDIRETQAQAPNYPLIGDSDLSISKLYGLLPADLEGPRRGTGPPVPRRSDRGERHASTSTGLARRAAAPRCFRPRWRRERTGHRSTPAISW